MYTDLTVSCLKRLTVEGGAVHLYKKLMGFPSFRKTAYRGGSNLSSVSQSPEAKRHKLVSVGLNCFGLCR